MRSVLNEASFFNDILKQYSDVATKVANSIASKKNSNYLGGSISKYTKNLVLSFPVLCDNTLSISTIQMISKATEKNIVSMLKMLLSAKSINGDDGREILSRIHMNIDADIEDIIDAIDRYCEESGVEGIASDAECRDAIREMVYQLRTPQKSFPEESFNETSINDYYVRNFNGKYKVVSEGRKSKEQIEAERREEQYKQAMTNTDMYYYNNHDGSRTPLDLEKNERERRKDEREVEKNKRDRAEEIRKDNRDRREEEKFGYEKQRDSKRDRYQKWRDSEKDSYQKERDAEKDRNDRNNFFTRQVLDTDFKKANELQPTLLVVNFNSVGPDGKSVIERKSFIAGVKCRMMGTDAMDIVERLVSKNKTKLSFKNLLRATTGEISFARDFLLAINQQKLNAKNAAKKGNAARMWNVLEKRATANRYNEIRKKSNDASSITTLVVNAETVNYMISAYKFDLNNPKNAKLIMDSYNFLSIVIADDANEYARFIYDGDKEYQEVAYAGLSKQASDKNAYKDMVNLINRAGR